MQRPISYPCSYIEMVAVVLYINQIIIHIQKQRQLRVQQNFHLTFTSIHPYSYISRLTERKLIYIQFREQKKYISGLREQKLCDKPCSLWP